MEKEADFGRTRRIWYIAGVVAGNLLSYYLRGLFYTRKSQIWNGCPFIIFKRPWMGTLVMTIGISLCTLVYYIKTLLDPKNHPKFSHTPTYIYLFIALIAFLDIFISIVPSYTISENLGPFSVATRYFDLLFIIIIQNVFMTPIRYAYQWVSLGIVAFGIVFVAVGVFKNKETRLKLLPSLLQLASQLFISIRTVLIQKVSHENDINPWFLTGFDGIFGFLIVLFGGYPLAYFLPEKSFSSLHENLCSSALLTFHSISIIILFLIYIPITCIYNASITGTITTTNAVGYTIVEMICGSINWIIDLIIFHAFNGKFILEADKKFGVE
ncbi:hypothetical protein TVAG_244310 [Trichomonas vaginalis G3]|uniref:Uncharacterized protein n=1 Tax=Trichomonas vaginalis (strain ATCC PRA-98 / G3) TaxID=412133 RepID=A2ES18_TRIV3|nr:solute carrier family 35 member F6 family [Trichomonas vaginalis G3]EAY04530.1 hypothetical protein TVAG_244310 [Trichomonas vaginalis G3]KAI5508469.1 solute carrier family 35 member F6 family [Trichomonas vaginalis G3]|eukprot:XP_001316753.1 hypothetical protein [Trichomonas vaginalis G3]